MGFFNWAAPLVHRYGHRWSPDDVAAIAGQLHPFMSGACPQGCRVLDVGGGGGVLATRLHETIGAQVTVLDPTPELVAYVPDDGPITAVLGSAETIPFDDDTFDAIVVTDAFHHFRDQPSAVREFARVVRHGGGVLVWELDSRPLGMRLVRLAEIAVGEPGAFFTPDELCAFMAEHGVAGECTPERGASYRFVGRVVRTGN